MSLGAANDPFRAGPVAGAPVLEWPDRQPAPALPAGAAGIAVRVRPRSGVAAVGVDGTPRWSTAEGRWIALVDPGDHLVEVRRRSSTDTVRAVRVAAGEIAEFDFVSRSGRHSEGVLERAPGRRNTSGGLAFLIGLAALGVAVFLLSLITPWVREHGPAGFADGLAGRAAVVAGVVVFCFALAWPVVRGWGVLEGRLERRHRSRISETAGDPATGVFLGDGDGDGDGAGGTLVVTATAESDWDAVSMPFDWDTKRGWLPWPVLTVDGQPRPLSWRTWGYRLPPGTHTLTVTQPAPADARLSAGPATLTVRIEAGRVTRVRVLVRATYRVGTYDPAPSPPVLVYDVTATVTAAEA